MPNFQFSKRVDWLWRDKILSAPLRGQKIIVNQRKAILLLVSIKPFTCQSFRQIIFHAKLSRRFLLRRPFNIPYRYQICIPSKCLFSHRDDFPQNLIKIMPQDCKKSTFCWRAPLLKLRIIWHLIGVYTKNRNFRILNSTKIGKNSPLLVSSENAFKVI